jgi:hypothetical protein
MGRGDGARLLVSVVIEAHPEERAKSIKITGIDGRIVLTFITSSHSQFLNGSTYGTICKADYVQLQPVKIVYLSR